jgi:hypothetical protein
MDIYDPKKPIFAKAAVGPIFRARLGRKDKWAFNYVMLVYDGAHCDGNFRIAGQWINMWQYLGISYTIKTKVTR